MLFFRKNLLLKILLYYPKHLIKKICKMKKIFFLLIVVSFPAITWVSCSRNEADKNPPLMNTKTYSLYSVKEQALGNILRLPAQLSAYESVNIYPRVTGYIKNIPVDIGTEDRKSTRLNSSHANI